MANSKILNIQLIDSRTFRLITGIDAPATPITPETYKQMVLPFYELWQEKGRPNGVAGKWGSVKGAMAVANENTKGPRKRLFQKSVNGSGLKGESEYSSESASWGGMGKGKGRGSLSTAETDDFKEPSFDFPIVLLGVDDTVPEFKSVMKKEVEEEEEDWTNEEDLYRY